MAKLGWIALAAALVPAGALAAEDEGSTAPGSAVEAPAEGTYVAPAAPVQPAEPAEPAMSAEPMTAEEMPPVATGETQTKKSHKRGPDEGLEVQANIGLLTFPGEGAVGSAATYGVGIGIEPKSLIGIELGYQGVAYSEDIRLVGNNRNGDLGAVENGAYGLLKISPYLASKSRDMGLEPYALGGIAVSHLNTRPGRDNADGQLQDDTFGKVPVGLGVDAHFGKFTAGLRGTYDFLFSNEHAFQVSTTNGDDQLIGTLHLGAQF